MSIPAVTQGSVAAALPADTARARPQSKHLAYIDGARAIAALYVVLHHCWQFVWTDGPHPESAWSYSVWLSHGHYAVSAFIAISGFSLMLPVIRGDGHLPGGALSFFKRRARRIVLPYYCAIALALVLNWLWLGRMTGTAWDAVLPVTPRSVIMHVLLLQDVDRSGLFSINGVFWTIAIEWHIYFFFPLLVLLARRVTTLATALSTALLCYLVSDALLGLPADGPGRFDFLPGRAQTLIDFLGLFALGMLAATVAFSARPGWVAVRRKVPWQLVAVGAVITLIGAFTLTSFGTSYGPIEPTPQVALALDVLTGVAMLTVFIAAASSERSLGRLVLSWRPLVFFGTFAYSIYLIHAPVIALVYIYVVRSHLAPHFHLGYAARLGTTIALAAPIALAVAYGFFLVCERPFLNKPLGARAPAWGNVLGGRVQALGKAVAQVARHRA